MASLDPALVPRISRGAQPRASGEGAPAKKSYPATQLRTRRSSAAAGGTRGSSNEDGGRKRNEIPPAGRNKNEETGSKARNPIADNIITAEGATETKKKKDTPPAQEFTMDRVDLPLHFDHLVEAFEQTQLRLAAVQASVCQEVQNILLFTGEISYGCF